MFTGIVEELGEVVALEPGDGRTRIEIRGRAVLSGTRIGDSIAVQGVCLTVVAMEDDRFSVDAVPETLRRTNLSTLGLGDAINLERAVRGDRPFGGHYVQGHVDGTAQVAALEPDGDAVTAIFSAPPELTRYVVPKGYVALDGTSLTVCDVTDETFSITLIPHTRAQVTLGQAAIGDAVNVEVDVLGKYVARVAGERLDRFEARLSRLEKAQSR